MLVHRLTSNTEDLGAKPVSKIHTHTKSTSKIFSYGENGDTYGR